MSHICNLLSWGALRLILATRKIGTSNLAFIVQFSTFHFQLLSLVTNSSTFIFQTFFTVFHSHPSFMYLFQTQHKTCFLINMIYNVRYHWKWEMKVSARRWKSLFSIFLLGTKVVTKVMKKVGPIRESFISKLK